MDIAPGTRLDAYEIVALLGRGGMGEVWLARDVTLDRKTAVKVLPASISADSDRVARFRHEARVASALNHPNVCTIHMLGVAEDGQLFIAMEYIEGTTLRKRLTHGPLRTREVIDIATQIASGLSAAHAAGVVHRDVKPENVMIRSDGLVKVLDFGLAKLDTLNVADSTRSAFVTAGAGAGTVAYMSPEQASGEPLDARTDIFSLGAVLYKMATGNAPFTGTSTAIVHDGILNRTPTSPVRLNGEVPPRLEDLIMKALEKDRALRYQTAGELKTDLMRLKRDSDSHAASSQRISGRSSDSLPGRSRSSRVAVLLALTVMVGLLAVIGFRGLRTGLPRSEWQEIQLTTNSSENPVSAASISPDGRIRRLLGFDRDPLARDRLGRHTDAGGSGGHGHQSRAVVPGRQQAPDQRKRNRRTRATGHLVAGTHRKCAQEAAGRGFRGGGIDRWKADSVRRS